MTKDLVNRPFHRMWYSLLTEEGEIKVLYFDKGDECSWPEDLKAFIASTARCAYCDSLIYKNWTRCRCGSDGRYHLKEWSDVAERESKLSQQSMKWRVRREREANGAEAFTEVDYRTLYEIHDGCCYYCGRAEARLQIEHVRPLSRGGKHIKSNIVLACSSCNGSKGTSTEEAFWRVLSRKHSSEWLTNRKRNAANIRAKIGKH